MDLLDELRKVKPTVIRFSGHGAGLSVMPEVLGRMQCARLTP
jgi:hypothetical protein